MNEATLHYVFDPLCGWCYAAAPLVEAAQKIPGLSIELHAGGMMSDHNRRQITPQWRDFVMPHDHRIAALSGQPFGDAYFNVLLRDTTAVLDSTPPIAAILAAQALSAQGLAMLHRTQRAHYVEGRRIADAAVLLALAEEMGFAPAAFGAAYEAALAGPVKEHIAESRLLLRRVGGNGFPTFVLERPGLGLALVESSAFLGHTQAWTDELSGLIKKH